MNEYLEKICTNNGITLAQSMPITKDENLLSICYFLRASLLFTYIQLNLSCEATPFAQEMYPLKGVASRHGK